MFLRYPEVPRNRYNGEVDDPPKPMFIVFGDELGRSSYSIT